MNRLPAFAALAFALSTLCACDPTAVINHNAQGPDQIAPPSGAGCPDGDAQLRCSPPVTDDNFK